jgi:hypothetical protein
MFLRKLFNTNNKFTWVLIDLLIVIIGVYCAFLIQNSSSLEKDRKEQEKVFTALKYELEHFRLTMPGMSGYAKKQVEKYMPIYQSEEYANFTDWRFIQPQYPYQVIEYAINIQNTDIVGFELYSNLQKLFVEIKKLEHAESLIMETSMRYQSLPAGLAKSSPTYQIVWANNYDNFRRFITFMDDRSRTLQAVADASQTALPIINRELGPVKTKEIETQIILSNAYRVKNEDQALAFATQAFPNFTEEEIKRLYRKATDTTQSNSETIPE